MVHHKASKIVNYHNKRQYWKDLSNAYTRAVSGKSTFLNKLRPIFTIYTQLHLDSYSNKVGGDAMVLGKLPVPGCPTIWITVGQGPTALAVGAGGGCLDILLSSVLSLFFLPLGDGPI